METVKTGKEVGILTNFTSHDNAYSLCNVVEDQIKMLLMAEIKPVVFVQESGWWKNPDNIKDLPYAQAEIVMIPGVACHNEVKIDETFQDDVDKLAEAIEARAKDLDVILTHDVIYQPAAMKHNVAARKVASKYPNIKWLHWIHSATSPYTLTQQLKIFQDAYIDNITQKFPNSKYVFFNHMSIKRIAHNFKIDESDVAIVHHPTDVYEMMRFTPIMREFSDKHNLLDVDYIALYPARLDRGKQVEYMIKTVASLKKLNNSVRAIVADFHSTGGDKVTYRENLKQIGKEWGLLDNELIFTSEFIPEWKARVPRDIVGMLFQLSNVFVMPCVSESYSLVAQEAALLGNIIVANEDFIPFRDILGPHVIWRQYSSNIDRTTIMDGSTNTNYDNEQMYHMETAMKIVAEAEKSIEFQQKQRVRKTRNLRYIMNHELVPLIY